MWHSDYDSARKRAGSDTGGDVLPGVARVACAISATSGARDPLTDNGRGNANRVSGNLCMGRLVASINVTLDGYCNHDYVIDDEDLLSYACALLDSTRTILFGRATYQIFESYWPQVVDDPDSVKHHVQFATRICSASKVVFSKSLKAVKWNNARIAERELKSEILALKSEPTHDLLIFGSPAYLCP